MNSDSNSESTVPLSDLLSEVTSELNNLLQILSGTSYSIEQVCEGNEALMEQLTVFRATIERAEKVVARLVKQAGGPTEQILANPKLGDLSGKNTSGGQSKIAQSNGKKKQILIVDDEQVTLGLISRILSEADYEVTTAQSGFECLDHFRRQPLQFDLVMLDLTMPFMDGEETFHRLRELRPDVPVVMCTGFIQHERLQRLMSEGLAGFLRKPLPPDEIIGCIRSTLAKIRYSRDQFDSSRIPVQL